jgi:hypothetical protein
MQLMVAHIEILPYSFARQVPRGDQMPKVGVIEEWLERLPGLDQLWAITKGRPEVRIGVLDGPIDESLLAQAGSVPTGVVQHGTHVYSIISGTTDPVVPGIAPGCSVLSIPVFGASQADARQICSQEELAAGIQEALELGCNIINISASQQADLLSLSSDLNAALQEAAAQDVLVVAATGNQGCGCDTIPASVAGVLAVGAHGADGLPLLASNRGQGHRAQGIIAPGNNIPGACVGGGLCRATGTSFAAATVSGVAGLLMSLDVERGLAPSGERTRRVLIASSTPPPDGEIEMAAAYLSGRLNVASATKLMLGASSAIRMQEGNFMEAVLSGIESDTQQPILPAAAIVVPDMSGVGIAPAGCGCGCGGGEGACTCSGAAKKAQFVYAIGRLGISFISQARRDSIWRAVNGKSDGDLKPISDAALGDIFKRQPFQAQSVIWTLSRTEVPMYAIVPTGAYAAETYRWLVEEWTDADVEFASIPGVLAGQVTLYDGQTVDVLVPDLRGMYSWETKKYVRALTDERKKAKPAMTAAAIATEMDRFLGKIYFSIRNRGLSPEERALNAAATNAFNFSPIIVEIGQEGMTLRDISVERSPLNRPGSEYYDVLLTFFDPNDRQGRAPLRARFTIDVSDTVPVMIGDPVTWHEY